MRKQMSSGAFKNVTYKLFVYWSYIYIYRERESERERENLTLNNLLRLICHKPNQPTKNLAMMCHFCNGTETHIQKPNHYNIDMILVFLMFSSIKSFLFGRSHSGAKYENRTDADCEIYMIFCFPFFFFFFFSSLRSFCSLQSYCWKWIHV